MPGPKMDGAGTVKMNTLEEALEKTQTLHGIVERMAIDVRGQRSTAAYGPQLRRAGTPLVGLLKGQFGMISDQVTALILSATRGGGGDQAKLRALREGVAGIRTALEIAVTRVKDQHAIEEAHKDVANAE